VPFEWATKLATSNNPFVVCPFLGRNVLQHCKWCTEIAVNIKIHTNTHAHTQWEGV